MTYQKQAWVDQETVISAARMDHIESGVEAAHGLADGLDGRLAAAEGALDALEPGAWVDLPLADSWRAYDPDGVSYCPGVRARRVPAGVQIQGMVRGGEANTVICNLPAGAVPEYSGHFAAISNAAAATVFVSNTGQVRYISGGSSTSYVSISLVIPIS